jgi:hypothetical protein
MNICKDSFYHLLKVGNKEDFIVQDCSCIQKNCKLPNENDMEILVKAYDFYESVSCLLIEGIEFCTKSELFDAIYREFEKVNNK